MVEELASGNKDSRDRRLVMWLYEAQLKDKYSAFVSALQVRDALFLPLAIAARPKRYVEFCICGTNVSWFGFHLLFSFISDDVS